MRILIVALMLAFAATAHSQESKVTDKLLEKICAAVKEGTNPNDSLRIMEAFEKHLFPVLSKMDSLQAEEGWNRAIFRLQRQCPIFKELLEKMSPGKHGDWEHVETMPESVLSKESCSEFRKHTSFKYLESTGDTVEVTILNGYWTDRFSDGTFSRLKLRWITDCEFEIVFIESNNVTRKNLSRPGDKYRYKAFNKGDGYYNVVLDIVGMKEYTTFKMYY